ncbi:MAG: DEAD/DEAH box helicase [Candidatus Pristimantibacillus lignocellulolyticus]|uniref:DEAD/DEAH box helicase n=1 Tax=Candidatus Pristimantibacillus lignocellulolyticus TaxID=2994561 RepID=A0A9J6ZAX8_9BACL|nr:MAG: DEAD/DEAH box helicase [Candidatus Pristimantibacillus lignocellulolyticus]
MNADNKYPIKELREFQEKFASEKLLPNFAKLYSHHTRLNYQQSGLLGWNGTSEFNNRINDAIKLIDVGLFDKKHNGTNWRSTLRRAGEVLEWLSHPDLNTEKYPTRFLSAASYQLAGYPAMATGLLNAENFDFEDSDILRSLLSADFPQLDMYLHDYWSEEIGLDTQSIHEEMLIKELIRSLGVLNMYMRWGEESRISIAQEKLKAISKLQTHHEDPMSWLLSKLCSELFEEYYKNSLRDQVKSLKSLITTEGDKALDKYLRNSYLGKKSLVWSSQIKGIQQLLENKSFALCTPTGTGKTTIAELAIIMSLFKPNEFDEDSKWIEELLGDSLPSAIAIYLVPSRALATEVEIKLNTVFKDISDRPVKVTGLYGGIDWGPTDAWITSNEKTVLICTYEKAEALIRFLGPLFLSRVSLVVIDEAHSIQFDGKYESLISSDNRSLRLEALSNRLVMHLDEKNSKVIALSAVAAGGSDTLAQWVSGSQNAQAEATSYRSTRQLIGRLEWSKTGNYRILYDIMNGSDLKFERTLDEENVPFIPRPFTPFPIRYSEIPKMFTGKGPSKKLRPYLFWAAIQMAKKDALGNHSSVLISVTQFISGYAQDFLYTLEKLLKKIEIPEFFNEPTQESNKQLWEKCLRSCEDYFGNSSVEYKLLKKGIVVHYGNMPGLTARLLVEVINKKIVSIVLATSTLSEGINLPFETVIIPTVIRNQELLPIKEFSNLVGRAGRPGVATEGRTLVMLEDNPHDWGDRQPAVNYYTILNQLHNLEGNVSSAKSPIAELLRELESKWNIAFNSNDKKQFMKWLEETVPLKDEDNLTINLSSEELLDTLDGILISAIVELELIEEKTISLSDLEAKLQGIWRKSYAYFASVEREYLEKVFLKRGLSIQSNIYPNFVDRRKIYRTSLSPRFANELISLMPTIKMHLSNGVNYHGWDTDKRLGFILESASILFSLKKFHVKESVGSGKDPATMEEVLRWWLIPDQTVSKPKSTQLSQWVKYINSSFTYQFNWGIGTVISLILDELHDGRIIPTRLEDWTDSGLPWIIFWFKEMITWGTLDPVVAYLLARGVCDTRKDALELATQYYVFASELDVDVYNAVVIRDWVILQNIKSSKENIILMDDIPVHLIRDFTNQSTVEWLVYPIFREDKLIWIDPAGYELAYSFLPTNALLEISKIDYILNYKEKIVRVKKYIE